MIPSYYLYIDVPYNLHEGINKISSVCYESVSISIHYSIFCLLELCNASVIFPNFEET